MINLIAIGNGTASRETELMIAEVIKDNDLDCSYLIVNEAGASVYSASPVANRNSPILMQACEVIFQLHVVFLIHSPNL
jgi:uncharacterized protein